MCLGRHYTILLVESSPILAGNTDMWQAITTNKLNYASHNIVHDKQETAEDNLHGTNYKKNHAEMKLAFHEKYFMQIIISTASPKYKHKKNI